MYSKKWEFYLRTGLLILLFAAVLLLLIPAKAETPTEEWTFDTGSGELILRGNGAVSAVSWQNVAGRVRRLIVSPGITALPEDAFAGCTQLYEVVLPEGLDALGSHAFAGCTALSSLTLPGSLCRLGADVFADCTGLEKLIFTGTSAQWRGLCLLLTASQGNALPASLTPAYTLPNCRFTVVYLAEDGTALAPTCFYTLTEEDSITIESPQIAGYLTDTLSLTLTADGAERQYIVTYRPITCTLTLQYTDENGKRLLSDRVLTLPFGAAVSESAPAIPGYETASDSTFSLESLTEDNLVRRFLYTPIKLTVTVECVDEAGNLLAGPLTVGDIPYGGSWFLSLPEIADFTSLSGNVGGDNLTESTTIQALYRPQYQTVTVSYLDEDGFPMQPGAIFRVKTGDSLSVEAPVISGYTVSLSTLTADCIISPLSLHFTYTPNIHTLLLRCVDADGTLLQEITEALPYGSTYTVTPPTVTGYTPINESVPPAGTMPDEDVELTVLYIADGISPTPTSAPVDPTGTVTPAPTTEPSASVTDTARTDPESDGNDDSGKSKAWILAVLGTLLLLTGITLFILLYNRAKEKKAIRHI